jgi:hypothetical protein
LRERKLELPLPRLQRAVDFAGPRIIAGQSVARKCNVARNGAANSVLATGVQFLGSPVIDP